MDAAWFASALAFAVSTSVTPGPNNMMLTASGAAWGFRRTLPHMLGITIGFPVMIAAVALGAGGILRALPWLRDAMRWVGAAYFLWLAWQIAASRPGSADAASGRPLSAAQAALFQWVNPKAWVIALGVVVTYASGGAVIGRALMVAAIFGIVSVGSTALWTGVGVGAGALLRTPRALRLFNLALAALLVASLLLLLLGE